MVNLSKGFARSMVALAFASCAMAAQATFTLYTFDLSIHDSMSMPISDLVYLAAPTGPVEVGGMIGGWGGELSQAAPGTTTIDGLFTIYNPSQLLVLGVYSTGSGDSTVNHVAMFTNSATANFITSNHYSFSDLFSSSESDVYNEITAFYDDSTDRGQDLAAINPFAALEATNTLTGGDSLWTNPDSSGHYGGEIVGFSAGTQIGSFTGRSSLATPAPAAFLGFGLSGLGAVARRRRLRG